MVVVVGRWSLFGDGSYITPSLGIILTTKVVKMIRHYIIFSSCFLLLVGPANSPYSQRYKSSQIEVQNQLPFACLVIQLQ
jgi:hypothetical protein